MERSNKKISRAEQDENGKERRDAEKKNECVTNKNTDPLNSEAACQTIWSIQSFKTPINGQSVVKSTSTVVTQSSIPLDVPSPFKRTFFWPKPKVSTRKRCKEKCLL
ncbi:hypothetical protein JTB14_003840 [Gonioctena quinquepunctata]|nr:hypothetical protein JTB14_003840 [Gonioctena quinquepunctata]